MDVNQAALDDSLLQDEDDDSDDNFLYVQPAALLQESSTSRFNEDAPIEVKQGTHDLEPVRSAYSHPVLTTVSSVKKLKYSLDCILQTSNIQDRKDAGLADLQKSLRHGIVEGGITKLVEEDDEQQGEERETKSERGEQELVDDGSTQLELGKDMPLLPEHEKTLKQYALESESIATSHPGEDIFSKTDIGKLFTFPVGTPLSSKANAMEKLVIASNPDELEELLMSRTILDIYAVKQCPDSVMLWLLQLLSICDNVLLAGMIYDTMWSLLNSFQHNDPNHKPWCPTLQDIAAIFVNYGARLNSLLPPSLLQRYFTIEDINIRYSQNKNVFPGCQAKPRCLPTYNLQQVIKIITQCLLNAAKHGKPSLHEEELISLAYLVCKVSLDRQLVRCPVEVDIQHCLAAVLNCFQEQTWNSQASKLCLCLTHCSSHHHNLVHLVRLMRTGTHRGKILCPLLSCTFLEKLTKNNEDEWQCSGDIQTKVSDLIPLLAACKPRCRTDTDYYQLHSLITLVELAVGYDKELYKSVDKEALAKLVIMLRDMAGDIRDSHKHLCRTQVKDLMIRIASELTYLEQTLTSKQAFLHTFMTVEQSETKATDNEASCHRNIDTKDTCHTNYSTVQDVSEW
ncbi:SMC5-SMC6 complex localization factor protein 2-like isoform X2 [Acanthaster planci]|uniref:SMC5-SMC6 complex localization factor protein 2-like isoform X2 n=1 Tax=Acanthaster planci TaxID=133434 RepID=A0A8B7XX87_ACAPL|nr:SMC5-SMC6 complex localization factor protein 2-like isoform X2 [Acanthaster planci]